MSKQFYLVIDGTEVGVSEDVYRAYKRPVWKEKKMLQRNNRCRDGNNIRCDGDCNICEFARHHGGANGSDISLEAHIASVGDIPSDYDVIDEIAEQEQARKIREYLNNFDGTNIKIAGMLADGYKQVEIAEALGISAAAVSKKIKKIRAALSCCQI